MSSVSRSIPITASSRYNRSSQKRDDSLDDIREDILQNTGMSESYSEILNHDLPSGNKSIEYTKYENLNVITNRSDSPELDDHDDKQNLDGTSANNINQKCTPSTSKGCRPKSLVNDSATSFPYNLEGTISKDGDITNFVAKDLENKIRLSSPVTKESPSQYSTSPSTSGIATATKNYIISQQQQKQQFSPQIASNVLHDIEIEAQYLAASADNLIENLGNLLHSISSITTDNVDIHKNAVIKLTDCMDANIKIMYTIMAKTEEISQSMKPVEQIAQRVQQIKRFVDMLESNL